MLAVLLCSPTIRTFLINFARPLIFSTALPHSSLIALDCAWDLLQSDEGEKVSLPESSTWTAVDPIFDSAAPASSPSLHTSTPSSHRSYRVPPRTSSTSHPPPR